MRFGRQIIDIDRVLDLIIRLIHTGTVYAFCLAVTGFTLFYINGFPFLAFLCMFIFYGLGVCVMFKEYVIWTNRG